MSDILVPGIEESVSSVYGPVFSWRFGRSLGIDLLLQDSICSYRCVYCQLGKINVPTTERNEYVATSKVLEDLKASDWKSADVITFSGNGEPTLASNLGEVILAVKKVTKKPIAVLTNASTLTDPIVQEALLPTDHVSAKLDAGTDELMMRINRPVEGLHLDHILEGFASFKKRYRGKLLLQTMVLPANVVQLDALAKVIQKMHPDEVHLNVPSRPMPSRWSIEYRGEHQSFESDRAFKVVPQEKIEEFGRALQKKTGISVLVPRA
jgi:wyosine [tRNA(Phe)-imidazoG37] synthetase (radical SAM superfamily)